MLWHKRSMTPSTAQAAWHTLPISAVSSGLTTDPKTGLSTAEAARRLAEYGPNQLEQAHHTSAWELLFEQFKNVLIIILLIAVGLSAVLGHEVEAIAIGVIVFFAVFLGFIQEFRAEKAMEALQKMAAPTATVLRGGKEIEIAAIDLVPGDIILLSDGDKVPADGRIIVTVSLHLDEAPLTGESVPVEKTDKELAGEKLPVGDRKNMVHAGTVVTYGRGKCIVTATGMQTEFGKIAGLLQSVKT